ncbi:MAG TPA: YqeG family HAD IIIA-type phosphatase [Firmicutes bacterium]|nr:YqeG family HAD IIIA-type phosphatase [Bacillota bacterium]
MPLFTPDLLKNRITDITMEDLRALGVRGLLLDVDNTLTTHGSQELDPAVRRWLEEMAGRGVALTVVSNGMPRRVEPFAKKLGLRQIAMACKPFPLGFWRGVRRLGLKRRECAAVGDQTFTDIVGSRLAGVRSIQLMPIELERQPTLRFKRMLERRILRRYRRKHGLPDPEETA